MKVDFFGLEVEIPDDPVTYIKTKVVQLLNYLGYEWPSTDPGTLRSWAGQWDALNGQLNSYISDLESGVRHIDTSNMGSGVAAFTSYMNSDDSNLHSLKSIAAAAPYAAGAYTGAAILIEGLRAYVIGKIILDAVQLAAAIISGGTSAAASFLVNKGVGLLINIAIETAINQLLGA